MSQVNVRLQASDYANRVLGVIKEKFGLRDKSEAFNKLVDLYGDEYVEKEPKEAVVREIIQSTERHIKKYGFRKISKKEFEGMFELN